MPSPCDVTGKALIIKPRQKHEQTQLLPLDPPRARGRIHKHGGAIATAVAYYLLVEAAVWPADGSGGYTEGGGQSRDWPGHNIRSLGHARYFRATPACRRRDT